MVRRRAGVHLRAHRPSLPLKLLIANVTMPPRRVVVRVLAPALACCVLVATPATAQPSSPREATDALASWLAYPAPPGEETRLTDAVLAADPRWARDALGNLVLRIGSGSPRRLVACGVGAVGLVVSEITDDGYLRLHRAGSARTHPLWDQFHEAQQVAVLTASARVPGVVAVPNGHFARQHRGDTVVVNIDMLTVDVGARTRAEAESLGVALLQPVVRDVPPWRFAAGGGDLDASVAADDASGRAACAAVATAAGGTPDRGETVFVIAVQRAFNWAGLAAAATALGRFDSVTMVVPAPADGGERPGSRVVPRPSYLPSTLGVDSVAQIWMQARFIGSHVETVRGDVLGSLRRSVERVGGITPGSRAPTPWLRLAEADVRPVSIPTDTLSALAAMLRTLAEAPGVPSHEHAVRRWVLAGLPGWARERAVVDSAGNVIVAVGPDRDTSVFVAHMDEVAYVVRAIDSDGTVRLQAQGGVIPSAWEGQPALLHFDPATPDGEARAPIPGVFVPRAQASVRRPAEVTAWFGMDGAALERAGVRVGQGVTAHKRGLRLGATRFTARALDDRAGTAALLLALQRLDTAALSHKVIFAWSVHEEGGLLGARHMARTFGASVRRVYAIDTFVSSDTPLESPHFAHTPLGDGPVLRGLDDGIASLPAERARVQAIARDAGIRLQVGTTHGSTDATPFVAAGATGMGLSWPGRYSHSPAELLDLRDLAQLSRLILAVATAPTVR